MARMRMRASRMAAMVGKDLGQVFRNRFMAVISLLLIILNALLYNLMPRQVEETFKLGIYLQGGGGPAAEAPVSESEAGAGLPPTTMAMATEMADGLSVSS
ncbi:MAG: hypothetical protein ACUVRX_07630 [Actinomycetota bacterium]